MHSGLVEAYVIYTVLNFFHQYIHLFPLTLEKPRSIQVNCDNNGIIEQINQPSAPTHPWDTLRDDFPIFSAIQHNIPQLHPYCVTFHHVCSHQDKQHDCPLTLPECLNINCDACAAKLPPPPADLILTQHPQIQAGLPHLCSDNQVIMQHLQQSSSRPGHK